MKDLYLSDDPTRPDPRPHNYWSMLQALAAQGKAPLGELTRASIYHDDDCAVFEGGYCNCDPDIVLRKIELPLTE